MIGSTHIVSLDDDGTDRDHEPATPAHTHDMGGLPNPDDAMEWLEYAPPPPSQKLERLIPALCVLALVMWTGLFVAVNISATGGLTQWLGWIAAWSGPVAVVGLVRVLTRKADTAPDLDHAERFSDTARQMQQDAALLESRLASVNAELSIARDFLAAQSRDLEALGRLATERLSQNGQALAALIHDNSAQITAIASVSTAALDNMEQLRGQMPVLTNLAKDVANTIGTTGRTASDQLNTLTHGMERLDALSASGEARIAALRDTLAEAGTRGEDLTVHVSAACDRVQGSISQMASFHEGVEAQTIAHAALLETMRQSLSALDTESAEVTGRINQDLSGALARLHAAALSAGAAIREQGGQAVTDIAARLGEESISAIERAIRHEMAALSGQLEQAAAHAAGVTREAGSQIAEQVGKVDTMVAALEARVNNARALAEEQVDNGFARRAALITEALNSSAIDIAKALDSDVTDPAWAAYLKGDRGIFTRTAVRLLDRDESKSVTQLYHNDDAFRDNVSRYIHDFEGMLRQILSTRDGEALGVTLLSSDMGKLYVALAQAIERLRS